MTTSTRTLYSRPIPFSEDQARAGDQIDISETDKPEWVTLIAVVPCTEENSADCDCARTCATVLHLEASDPEFWHVDWADYSTVMTRLPVDGA